MEIAQLQQALHAEDDVLASVRARVAQAVAVPDSGTGAHLAQLAEQYGVRLAVVVGTAGGVTCAWLLDGMVPRGIVTCIEPDGRRHALTADGVAELGLGDHVRLIHGEPSATSQRLRDGNYDLAVLQVPSSTPELLEIAARLLKVGGVLVVRHAVAADDAVADRLANPPWSLPVALDVDDGLLVAIRTHDDDLGD